MASPGGKAASGDLDAGSDRGSRLLVALCTSVALEPGHPVLTRALPVRLVADLPTRPHRVAVARPAGLLVGHRPVLVPVVALLAVVAVSPCCIMPALVADAT